MDFTSDYGYPAARFLAFAAHAVLLGLVPILVLVLRPGFAGLKGETWDSARQKVSGRLAGLVEFSLITAAAATFAVLLLQAYQIAQIRGSSVDTSTLTAVFATTYGRWLLLRVPLLLALGVLLIGVVRRSSLKGMDADEPGPTPIFWVFWGLLGLVLVSTSTFSGHSAVTAPKWLAVANDLIHLTSGATWFAGIVVLALVLPAAWRGESHEYGRELLVPIVNRFSRVALIAISVVAVTGTISSFLQVGALNDLIDSSYGRAVAIKIILLGVILALGGVNHFFVRKRLEESALEDTADVQRLFRKTVVAEFVVALAILGATGALTNLNRTREVVPVVPTSSVQSEP